MLKPRRAVRTVIAGALLIATPAFADEALFGYLYTTETLPKGVFEYEQWATANYRQSQGTYLGLPLRSEIEYGVTDNFQAALYLNYSYVRAFANNRFGETSGPGVPNNADPNATYRRWRLDGVSAEFIYRLLSPYKDPFGFALYLEPTWGSQESELEAKLLFQKNFLDDRLVLAANVIFEWSREKKTGGFGLPPDDPGAAPSTEKETQFEVALGASYLFAPGWRAGIEYRNVNHYAGAYSFSNSNKEWQASYLGPNIHYGSKKWWITFTALGQLPAGHAYNEEFQENTVNRRVYGSGGTRYAFRMRLGVYF
jgi:hypothetical protein